MKKIFYLAIILMFILIFAMNCANLPTVSGDDPKSISVLLKKLDQCKIESDGFVCLSIPLKDQSPDPNRVSSYAIVFKWNADWGFGVYSRRGFALCLYSPSEKTWMFLSHVGGNTITEKQMTEAWAKWVKMLNQQYDIKGAFCGKVPREQLI
jgi:hypothetical protein